MLFKKKKKKQRVGRVILLIKQCRYAYMYDIFVLTFFLFAWFSVVSCKEIYVFLEFPTALVNLIKIKIKIYQKKKQKKKEDFFSINKQINIIRNTMSTQTKCCGFFSKINTKPFFWCAKAAIHIISWTFIKY